MSIAGIPLEAFSDAIEVQTQIDEAEIQKLLAKQFRRLNELQERYYQPVSYISSDDTIISVRRLWPKRLYSGNTDRWKDATARHRIEAGHI